MKKGGGSESTIIIGPSKSVLVYALHSLEYVLGLARFRVFVPNLYNLYSADMLVRAPYRLIVSGLKPYLFIINQSVRLALFH